jgi:transposase-like protein
VPAPLDPTKRTAITNAIRAGGTCRGIAREHGVSPDTVRRIAADAGITNPFARTRTAAATRAKVADNKARRAELSALLLDDAHRLRVQLWQPCTIGSFGGRDNVWTDTELPEPTFADKRAIITAVNTAVRSHLEIERVDSDAGVDHAKSMLGALAEGLRTAYEQLPPDAED